MSKLKNEIEHGLDNFVKEPSDEVPKVYDSSKVYYDAIKKYIDDEFDTDQKVTLELIIKYISWRDSDLPIEYEPIICDIGHHEFSMDWGNY